MPGGRRGDRGAPGRRAGDRPDPGACRHELTLRCRARQATAKGRDMRTTTTATGRGRHRLGHPDRPQQQQCNRRSRPRSPGHLTVASQMREHHTELAQQRLTRKAWRLADKVAAARDRGFSPRAYRRAVARRAARPPRPPRARPAPRAPGRPARRARAAPARPPPPPRSRRSPPASPAATRPRTPATASTASSSSRSDVAERRRHRQPGRGQRGRAEPARRAALRARGRLALAGLRSLVVRNAWPSVTSSPSSNGSRT